MLSRAADSLYWLARYVERAENVARTVAVGYRMASMALSLGSNGNEWLSTLITTGCEAGFFAKYDEATQPAVIDYLVRDLENPSSILASIETARRNARAVRIALTSDMWDALNETWLGLREMDLDFSSSQNLLQFLDWVRARSQLFNGAYNGTMLRNDAFYFTRLGTFIERADNTARILDVKYHVLLPTHEGIGGALDYYQWQAILRSVSALRAYHWVYHDRLQPWLIGELLLLRPEMPRSLINCFDQITQYLDRLADGYGGRRGECHRLAGALHARLRYGRIQDIFQLGLHEFLSDFIDRSTALGDEISAYYLT
ncbi:MAG TPA: alpha-E domain-containing protein [Stellaceae bacterium]|nr:alpha-E domain-containing protein [Stellaceae bacterium]